jgi:D-inositol-3-phosphate glycosyltransferase
MLRVGVIMYQTSFTKGQELVAERMVRELRRLGYEAFLITSQYHDWEPVVEAEEIAKRGGYLHTYDPELQIPVIRVAGWKSTWPPRRIFFSDFVAILQRIVEDLKLDVLITHSTLWNGPEDVAKFVAWRRGMAREGVPQDEVLFCHMSHYQEPTDDRYFLEERSFRKTWNEASLPRVLAEADLVLCTTPLEAEAMARLGVPKEKCFLFPGGIDADALEGSSEELWQKLPRSKKIVSYLGTIEERKNVLAVLKVAQELSDFKELHFVIAGRPEGEYGEKVRQEAQKLSNVTYLGPISDEEKAELIRSAHANIILSRSEALGLVQLEHLYAGVPVVTSGVGGQAWLIRHGQNGFVVKGPDDIKGAAEALLKLARDRRLWSKMSRNARASVKHFTLTELTLRLAKRLLQLYEERSAGAKKGIAPKEKVLEAWVRGGERVIATTERLILQRGARVLSVPYSSILSIRRAMKPRWWLVGAGAALVALAILMPALPLQPTWSALLAQGLPWLARLLFVPEGLWALRVLLLGFSVPAFMGGLKKGFTVICEDGLKVFVPEAYERALRIADRLTPRELFAE